MFGQTRSIHPRYEIPSTATPRVSALPIDVCSAPVRARGRTWREEGCGEIGVASLGSTARAVSRRVRAVGRTDVPGGPADGRVVERFEVAPRRSGIRAG